MTNECNDGKGSTGLKSSLLNVSIWAISLAFAWKQGAQITEAIIKSSSSVGNSSKTSESFMWVFDRGTSTADWCENVVAAHQQHDWIAEFYNTISNFSFVLVAILGLKRVADSHRSSKSPDDDDNKNSPPLPGMFLVVELIMLVGIGFGSMLFHAHQSRVAQLADELPMSLMMIACLHCCKGISPFTTDPKYTKPLFLCYHTGVAFLWALYLYTHLYPLFLLCFLLQVIVMVGVTFDGTRRMGLSWKKFAYCSVSLVVGKVLWNMEQERLGSGNCDAPYTLLLHPGWHVGSSLSHYYTMSNLADVVTASQRVAEHNKQSDQKKIA